MGSVLGGLGLHALDVIRAPPQKLPFLHDALIVSLSFVHLSMSTLYLNVRQWHLDTLQEQKKEE